ncbi:MAG: filamentous hemagglutinin N-terminal domain-containing protein [Tildeniella nuda ZEHNDER 1965/U140]|jgi:filamentous hemagglutinin family protein|nr:filamentous hemagglutinin N-terminal domain-containing protein [Tildeniella nuda ZEHNDER 1965/U140]
MTQRKGQFSVPSNHDGDITNGKNLASEITDKAITSCLFAVVLTLAAIDPAKAQIAGDTTLPIGERSQVSGDPNIQIDGGAQRGSNLFHSFSQFSVPTGGSAFFNNAIDVQNIFSRITGGSSSTIDGLLRTNGTASLFLLNPNGILFGPNASLQIGGSFLATTGSSIRFADGTEFSATAPTTPVLTVSVPIGVQFGSNPGSIRVSGSDLQKAGNTIGLLGGDLTIEGGIRGLEGNDLVAAPSGRVELGSVAGNSVVSLTFADRGFTLGYGQVNTFQTIQLLQNSIVSANDGGDIQVQGKQVQLAGGSQIATVNTASSLLPGGMLTINASESVELLGTGVYTGFGEFPTGVFNQTTGASTAGTLTINTKQLLVRDGAFISASTSGAGQGGNLTVNAFNLVTVSGVSATDSTLFSGISVASNASGTGNAGNLVINTGNLSVSGGGQISATTFGSGTGGDLTVNASAVQLTGGSTSQVNGLFARVGSVTGNNTRATGQGGNLTINTDTLVVQNGSQVSTGTSGSGQAGNLIVNAAESVEVTGRSLSDRSLSLLSAGSTSAGAAGNLSVFTDKLTVQDGGEIIVSGTGTGVAGDLQITAPLILLNNQGLLAAETKAGQGNITLTTSDLRLRRNSLISTNATGSATGGNITINTDTLVALENSDITANSQESFGGRVVIDAQAIFGTQFRTQLTPESDITATSALGAQFSGLVTIQTPGIDPSQGLVQLQTAIVDLSKLVVQACSSGVQQAAGEFVITGRGGLPPSPTDATGEDGVLVDLGQPLGDRPTSAPAMPSSNQSIRNANYANGETPIAPLVQAQGWLVNSKGNVVLLAQSPTATTQAVPWMASKPECKVR